MPFSAWSSLLNGLILPEDAGPDDPAIILGPDLPPCMQADYSSAIFFRPPESQSLGAPLWFIAQRNVPASGSQSIDIGFVRWTDTQCGYVVYERHDCFINAPNFAVPLVQFGQIAQAGNLAWDAFTVPTFRFVSQSILSAVTGTDIVVQDRLTILDTATLTLGGAAAETDFVTTTYTSTSTSYTTTGATVVSALIIAPPSGKVTIEFSGGLSNSTAGAAAYLSPQMTRSGGGTPLTASDNHGIFLNAGGHSRFGASILVPGLIPGDFYTATLYHRVSSGTGTFSRRRVSVHPEYA